MEGNFHSVTFHQSGMRKSGYRFLGRNQVDADGLILGIKFCGRDLKGLFFSHYLFIALTNWLTL
jgi:hypothetical protein